MPKRCKRDVGNFTGWWKRVKGLRSLGVFWGNKEKMSQFGEEQGIP